METQNAAFSVPKVEVLRGLEQSLPYITGLWLGYKDAHYLGVAAESSWPRVVMEYKPFHNIIAQAHEQGVQSKIVTNITIDNLQHCKELMNYCDLYHLEGLKSNLAVNGSEYLSWTNIEDLDNVWVIRSTAPEIVEQQQSLFDSLLRQSIPAIQKIREIEDNRPVQRIEHVQGESEVFKRLDSFINGIESDAKVLVPQPELVTQLDAQQVFTRLKDLKLKKNVSVRLAASFGQSSKSTIRWISPFVQYRYLQPIPMNVAVFIRDDRDVLLISRGTVDDHDTLSSLVLSSYQSLVQIMVSTFEAWWNQIGNIAKMEEAKRHNELLLDLMTHDIGNHNQILGTNLELLEMLLDPTKTGEIISLNKKDSQDVWLSLQTAARAYERSVALVENIRRLEKMYRESPTDLSSQDLVSTVNSALKTVQNANTGQKTILLSLTCGVTGANQNVNSLRPFVLADKLLEEVFVNLFFNSVKATEDNEVRIDMDMQPFLLGPDKYWIVSISDYGRGISDRDKSGLFERFYSKASGTGLGLSIVRGLIERYKGQVWVGDRVPGDFAKGAKFGIILRSGDSRLVI